MFYCSNVLLFLFCILISHISNLISQIYFVRWALPLRLSASTRPQAISLLDCFFRCAASEALHKNAAPPKGVSEVFPKSERFLLMQFKIGNSRLRRFWIVFDFGFLLPVLVYVLCFMVFLLCFSVLVLVFVVLLLYFSVLLLCFSVLVLYFSVLVLYFSVLVLCFMVLLLYFSVLVLYFMVLLLLRYGFDLLF